MPYFPRVADIKTGQHGVPLLFAALLLLGFFQAWYELRSSGVEVERFRLSDPFKTPVIRFTPPVEHRSGAVAVLVHGYQCNKAMMAQLARYLGTGGIEAYSIDLPGHGESQETFSFEKGRSAAEAAISKIAERTGVPPEKLVLVGHSFGSMALGPAVLRRDVLASVFIGPGKLDGLSRRLPNNALIITAEHDYDYIKQFAQAMYDELTAGDRQPPGNLVGDFHQKDARLWEVVPGAGHVSLLLDERVHRMVARWIERSSEGSIPVKASYSTPAAARAAAYALALCLLVAFLTASLVRGTGIVLPHNPSGHWVRPAIALTSGLYFSMVLTSGVVPLRFLRLEEGDILASLLAAAGILGFAFLAALDEKISWRLAVMDLAVGALVFISLYGLALITIDGEFYNLRIAVGDWKRWMTLAIVAVLAAPVFLLQEELLRRLQGASDRWFRGFAISCAGSLVLAAMFCSSLYFVGGRLYRFNAELVGVLLYCSAASVIFRTLLKNPSAGVLFSSLVTGWIISVGFFHY